MRRNIIGVVVCIAVVALLGGKLGVVKNPFMRGEDVYTNISAQSIQEGVAKNEAHYDHGINVRFMPSEDAQPVYITVQGDFPDHTFKQYMLFCSGPDDEVAKTWTHLGGGDGSRPGHYRVYNTDNQDQVFTEFDFDGTEDAFIDIEV